MLLCVLLEIWHVGLNMYVLHNFGSALINTIGWQSFSLIYGVSGLLGSILSVSWHRYATKSVKQASLGASSCILGVITFFALWQPNSRFQFIFLPFEQFSFSGYAGLCGLIAFDIMGLILRWKFFDHAAHLGGHYFLLFCFVLFFYLFFFYCFSVFTFFCAFLRYTLLIFRKFAKKKQENIESNNTKTHEKQNKKKRRCNWRLCIMEIFEQK